MRGPGNTCLAEILLRGGELYVHDMRLQLEEMRQQFYQYGLEYRTYWNVQMYIMTIINIFAITQ